MIDKLMDGIIVRMRPGRHTMKENLLSALIGSTMGLIIFVPLLTKAHIPETDRLLPRRIVTEEYVVTAMAAENIQDTVPELIEEKIIPEQVEEVSVQEESVQEEEPVDILATLDPKDLDVFARCVEAEAGNQGLYGKQLVADVILNRVKSRDFPDTITDVIMERNSNGVYQFSVVDDGAIERVTPTEETYEAIRTELAQIQYPSLMYFSAEGHLPYGTPWKKVGGHYFNIG